MLNLDEKTGTWSYSLQTPAWGLINSAPAVKLADGQIISARDWRPVEILADPPDHRGGWRISWLNPAKGLRITQTLTPANSAEQALMIVTEVTNTGIKPLALAEV